MEKIHVSCAIIIKEAHVLIAQRSEQMIHPMQWEFPGGKLKQNETPQQSIVREIKEELACLIAVHHEMVPIEHIFADKIVVLYPFICKLEKGVPTALEHSAIRWIKVVDFAKFNWVEADIEVANNFIKIITEKSFLLDNMNVNLKGDSKGSGYISSSV